MRDKRMYDSWDKVVPSKASQSRMLASVLTKTQSKPRKVTNMKKRSIWKIAAPVAACLVMAVAITAIFGNSAGWFGSKIYTAKLEGGTLNFYKSEAVSLRSMDFGFETLGRELTETENGLLFGGIKATSYGLFSEADKTLLHVEGRSGNTKIVLAANGIPVTDTVIETKRTTSEVNGIPVSAGYWLTDKNSNGEQNIIYLASYEQDGVTVYLENSGSLGEEDKVKADIANVVDTLTKNGMSYLPGVYFDTNIEKQISLYTAGEAWVSLIEGNKYLMSGPATISFSPSGTYKIEGKVLTLFDGSEEAHKFLINDDTIVLQSSEWLENWMEPGTVFILSEPK